MTCLYLIREIFHPEMREGMLKGKSYKVWYMYIQYRGRSRSVL